MPYFKPVVDTEGRRLIDGAYVNSIPADKVKELGADYIISVDLSAFSSGDLRLNPFTGEAINPSKQGYDYSTVMITPNLKNFKPTNISARHEMYELGYNAVMEKSAEVLKVFKK